MSEKLYSSRMPASSVTSCQLLARSSIHWPPQTVGGGGRWTHLWASGAVPSVNPTELWDINVPRLQHDSCLLSISMSKAALSLLCSILFCLEILNYGILLLLFNCLIGNLWVRWISLMMPVVTHMSNILRISQLPQSWLVKSMRR